MQSPNRYILFVVIYDFWLKGTNLCVQDVSPPPPGGRMWGNRWEDKSKDKLKQKRWVKKGLKSGRG